MAGGARREESYVAFRPFAGIYPLLQRDAEARVVGHVWVGSKAHWDDISDHLPQWTKGVSPATKQK